MRVLWINSVCGAGSTGKIVVGLYNTACRAGHEGKIFYGVGEATGVSTKDATCFGSRFDYYLHNLRSRLTDHAGFYSTKATERLITGIIEYDPDVIHLHNLHGYYLNVDRLFRFLKEFAKPIVWTLHDCWAFTGHCTHFSSAACSQWESCCKHCSQLKRYPKCYFSGDVEQNYLRKRELFSSLDEMILVTPSHWLAQIVKRSFLGNYEIKVIPNGIDTSIFRPQESELKKQFGLENKKIALGVASVWNERKGLPDFHILAGRLPSDWQLVLVGLNEKQKAAMPNNVVALDRISSQSELARIYSAADVFINPSYEETMGLTTVEALACGTPAIVYDRTAVPETIDRRSGIIVKAGDIDALSHEIVNCTLKRSDARARGERYDQLQQNEAYLRLYEKLSGSK